MTLKTQLRSFRLVCEPRHIQGVEALLFAQGFRFEPEPFFPLARRLTHEPFPLGSSLALKFGYIYIQDRSSMLPPLALDPGLHASVFDLCASPGGKTGLLAQLVGSKGFVLGNEPSQNRVHTLRRNIQSLNLIQCATSSLAGEDFPADPSWGELPPKAGWQAILLDPPCSAWGTAEKNPRVLALWTQEKIRPLITLQRALLKRAYELLLPGGSVLYSTCTTNPEENERQIAYATEELGFSLRPLPLFPGFSYEPALLSLADGALRVRAQAGSQGFFIARLEKSAVARTDFGAPPQTDRPPSHLGRGNRFFPGAQKKRGGSDFRALQPAASAWTSESLLAAHPELALLPPGKIIELNGSAWFMQAKGQERLPTDVPWRGFLLGKIGGSGLRINPALRLFLPELERAEAGKTVNIEQASHLEALCSGQSMAAPHQAKDCALYFHGLPLCRLVIKGRRAMLPALPL